MPRYERLAVRAVEEFRLALRLFALQIIASETADQLDSPDSILASARALLATYVSAISNKTIPDAAVDFMLQSDIEINLDEMGKANDRLKAKLIQPLALFYRQEFYFKNEKRTALSREVQRELAELTDLPLSSVTRLMTLDESRAKSLFVRTGKIRDYVTAPLIEENEDRSVIYKALARLSELRQGDPKIWSFWEAWYKGIITGTSFDASMLREIACINNEVWAKGRYVVATHVNYILAKYEVRKIAIDLVKNFPRDLDPRLHIGGNFPPETIIDGQEGAMVPEALLESLVEVESQTRKRLPSSKRLTLALNVIERWLTISGQWVARKVDEAVSSAAKWAGPVIALWVTQNADNLVGLIEAAKKWISLLPLP